MSNLVLKLKEVTDNIIVEYKKRVQKLSSQKRGILSKEYKEREQRKIDQLKKDIQSHE